MRYISMLDEVDIKKEKGNLLIQKIFNLEKFKGFKNQSLQIFDNESRIEEEEGVEEAARRVHVNVA